MSSDDQADDLAAMRELMELVTELRKQLAPTEGSVANDATHYEAQALRYANSAHEHFEAAVHSMGQADRTNDVRSWQNFLAEARAHVGISRLALELGNVPDTRAVQ